MVEQVRYLRSELYPKAFPNCYLLQQRHRDDFRRRPLNGSTLRIAEAADIVRRIDKRIGIDPLEKRLALEDWPVNSDKLKPAPGTWERASFSQGSLVMRYSPEPLGSTNSISMLSPMPSRWR